MGDAAAYAYICNENSHSKDAVYLSESEFHPKQVWSWAWWCIKSSKQSRSGGNILREKAWTSCPYRVNSG